MLPGVGLLMLPPGIPLMLPRCMLAGDGPLSVEVEASPEPIAAKELLLKFDVEIEGLWLGGLAPDTESLRVTM